ncbi:MAG: phosphodiesterase [Clostridia bacterium]|nr:phosphodiesterase [Clostridia bacterium]
MKLMIASDLHGDAACTRTLLDRFDESGALRLLLLGDLLYHGPRNDLPAGYAPKEVIALLNARRDALLCVRGNCDTEVDQMVLNFPILSEFALVDSGRHVFCLTHGHKNGEGNPPPLRPGDILLCGHTHVPACRPVGDLENRNFYVNPGSVSIPKDGSPKSYILYDSTDGSLSFRTLGGDEYQREYLG